MSAFDDKRTEFSILMEPASESEKLHVMDMALRLARKVMGEGREQYGALDFETDTRTVDECAEEACDEIADALFYASLTLRKARPKVWKAMTLGVPVQAGILERRRLECPYPGCSRLADYSARNPLGAACKSHSLWEPHDSDDDPSPPSVGARERQS